MVFVWLSGSNVQQMLGRPLSIFADWYYDAGIERGRIELECLTIGK